MVPTWPKMSKHSHSPKWPKISLIWSQLLPNKGRHKPQNTPKSAQHEPNMVPTLAQDPRSAQRGPRSQNCTLLFCKSKIGFAHAPCPPHPPRAKLHQLLALFQRFPSSKIGFAHAPCPRPPPLGQSYINSLRCSSAFRHQKLGLHTLHAPAHTPPPIAPKTISNVVHKLYFSWYFCFLHTLA